MASQNGYSLVSRDDCKFYDLGTFNIPLRNDDCGFVLAHFARRFANSIERLGPTETFGHALRKISGSDEWSNHASGTATDLNASQHPYGEVNTFSRLELIELRRLLDDYDEVIKWGGDYRFTKDEMHFEIDASYDAVHKLAQVLRKNNRVSLRRLKPGNRNIDVYMVKRALYKRGLFGGSMTNYFGKGLINAYREYQESLGYTGALADGIPGVVSLEELGFEVI